MTCISTISWSSVSRPAACLRPAASPASPRITPGIEPKRDPGIRSGSGRRASRWGAWAGAQPVLRATKRSPEVERPGIRQAQPTNHAGRSQYPPWIMRTPQREVRSRPGCTAGSSWSMAARRRMGRNRDPLPFQPTPNSRRGNSRQALRHNRPLRKTDSHAPFRQALRCWSNSADSERERDAPARGLSPGKPRSADDYRR